MGVLDSPSFFHGGIPASFFSWLKGPWTVQPTTRWIFDNNPASRDVS